MIIIEKKFDALTQEEIIIEREATAVELQEREAFELEVAKLKAAQEQATAQRQTLLAKLGITEDEAKLLLSQKGQ